MKRGTPKYVYAKGPKGYLYYVRDGISLTQAKTKTAIYIPLTARLRRSLADAPRKGLFIVCQDNGLRVGYNLAWKDIMAVRRAIGAEAYDIHALRHYAASQIAALPGMTADHVRALKAKG